MAFLEDFKKARQKKREERALLSIRNSAATLGYDLSELTDKQLRRGCRYLEETIRERSFLVQR